MWEYLHVGEALIRTSEPEPRGSTREVRATMRALLDSASSAQARWLEREQKMRRAIAALAKLDDRTLLALGISHRSHIEWTGEVLP